MPNAPLLRRTELLDNAQIVAANAIVKHQFEGFGEVRQAAPAARFSKTESAIRGPAPFLGEHTDDILAQLGYPEDVRQDLVKRGIVKSHRTK